MSSRVNVGAAENKMGQIYYQKHGLNMRFWEDFVRPRVLAHYNNICQGEGCGKTHPHMNVHHTSYKEQNINTLIPLCPSCHKKEHARLKAMGEEICQD